MYTERNIWNISDLIKFEIICFDFLRDSIDKYYSLDSDYDRYYDQEINNSILWQPFILILVLEGGITNNLNLGLV